MQSKAMRGLRLQVLLVIAAWTAHAFGTSNQKQQMRGGKLVTNSFVRDLSFKQRLRICNAYPYESPLEVFIGKMRLTEEAPLSYMSCGQFLPELHIDDEIDFKVDGTTAGTFTISDLPQSDAVLLMVIYRHSVTSTAVAFESHVFANLDSPQIAVLDTYKGTAQAELRIQDTAQAKAHLRSELLRFDNVVAVDPGVYEVLLRASPGNETKARKELIAVPRESYVVIRCGVEAQLGKPYAEDLMVYPVSDRTQLGSAASFRRGLRLLVGGLVSLVSMAQLSAL